MLTRRRLHRTLFFDIVTVLDDSERISRYAGILGNSAKFVPVRRCSLRYLLAVARRGKAAELARKINDEMRGAQRFTMLGVAVSILAIGRSLGMERTMDNAISSMNCAPRDGGHASDFSADVQRKPKNIALRKPAKRINDADIIKAAREEIERIIGE